MGKITTGIGGIGFGNTVGGDPGDFYVGDLPPYGEVEHTTGGDPGDCTTAPLYPPATGGTLSRESTTAVRGLPPGACPWCSRPSVYHWVFHNGPCPRVRAVEYYPDGSIKRVEFWPEEDRLLAEAGLAEYADGLRQEDENDDEGYTDE